MKAEALGEGIKRPTAEDSTDSKSAQDRLPYHEPVSDGCQAIVGRADALPSSSKHFQISEAAHAGIPEMPPERSSIQRKALGKQTPAPPTESPITLEAQPGEEGSPTDPSSFYMSQPGSDVSKDLLQENKVLRDVVLLASEANDDNGSVSDDILSRIIDAKERAANVGRLQDILPNIQRLLDVPAPLESGPSTIRDLDSDPRDGFSRYWVIYDY